MTHLAQSIKTAWEDACLSAAVLAVAPHEVGGIHLHARPSSVRETWLEFVQTSLTPFCKTRRLPLNIGDDRLIGGLDLSGTLAQGKLVMDPGILADVDQGLLIIPSAERLELGRAAKIVRSQDYGYLEIARGAMSTRVPTRFGILAIDERLEEEEPPPPVLCDRLALSISLEGVRMKDVILPSKITASILRARDICNKVTGDEDYVQTLCQVAEALGIVSVRAPLQTLKIARILAALKGELALTQNHLETAVRLVLSPRATRIPQNPKENPAPEEPDLPPSEDSNNSDKSNEDLSDDQSRVESSDFEILLSAACAAIPQGLFEKIKHEASRGRSTPSSGKAGEQHKSLNRGRPCGVRRGEPRNGLVLNLMETLRASAPFQTLRRNNLRSSRSEVKKNIRIKLRTDDFRISQFKKRKNATTIFVVDASGSSALERLAEVKGAVELILSECYIRRDHVAVIAFRGKTAETLLPPTRSLTRAQRCISALPGGGGTPLATAIENARILAVSEKQKGLSPTIVLLTDGKANIDKQGKAGRKTALSDAFAEGLTLRNLRIKSVLIDTSQRTNTDAEHLASGMGARYIPLPHANSARVAKAVVSSRS